jgi:hypothetical protein
MPNQNLAMHCAHGCYDLTPSFADDVETNQESRISRESLAYVTCASQYTFIFQIVTLRDHHFLHTKTIGNFYTYDKIARHYFLSYRHYFLSIRFIPTLFTYGIHRHFLIMNFIDNSGRQFLTNNTRKCQTPLSGNIEYPPQWKMTPPMEIPPQWKYRSILLLTPTMEIGINLARRQNHLGEKRMTDLRDSNGFLIVPKNMTYWGYNIRSVDLGRQDSVRCLSGPCVSGNIQLCC